MMTMGGWMSRRLLCFVAVSTLAGLSSCVGTPTIDQTSEALGYPNDGVAFEFFVGKGLTEAQSAGIVGNLDVESGVSPTAVQSGGPGRGIAQWSVGARWDTTYHDNTTWYAGQQGQSVHSLSLQLDFIWYELNLDASYGLAQLKATTTVTGATLVFSKYFEGCGACSNSTRITNAQHVYTTFMGTSGSDFSTAPVACTIANGDTGTCIDTGACATLGDHVSSAGFCSGAASIQCCTAVGPQPDAGTQPTTDGGAGDGATSTDGGLVAKPGKGCSASGSDPRSALLASLASLCVLFALRRRRAAS
ncbi:MAG: phage tail tip lysozyme [Polyangia bacterium]